MTMHSIIYIEERKNTEKTKWSFHLMTFAALLRILKIPREKKLPVFHECDADNFNIYVKKLQNGALNFLNENRNE